MLWMYYVPWNTSKTRKNWIILEVGTFSVRRGSNLCQILYLIPLSQGEKPTLENMRKWNEKKMEKYAYLEKESEREMGNKEESEITENE